MQEDMAESLTCAFLRQIKKDTGDGGIMEACYIILTYLNPVKEFPDFGFTDSFDSKATESLK